MTVCAACGRENRERRKFCAGCGQWLVGRGRPDDAQSLLTEARETFERLQALPWVERVDGVLPGAAAEVLA